jgi:hypothetical protein
MSSVSQSRGVSQSVSQYVSQSQVACFQGGVPVSQYIHPRAHVREKHMHTPNTVMDAHTSNSYRKFGVPTGTTGTPGHAQLTHPESVASGGPVSSNERWGTGTPGHGAVTALFVATTLESWPTGQPHAFARDVQINDTAYRRLDPEYYAWLRSKMNLAKLAADAGQLGHDEFEELRRRFNAVHDWVIEHFGDGALIDAIRNLDARDYAPPVTEPGPPHRSPRPADFALENAIAMVDTVAEKAIGLGWTGENLYRTSRGSFGFNCGLVHLLKPSDRIGEVTTHWIEIIRSGDVRHRFYNPDVDQPWIHRIKSAAKVF